MIITRTPVRISFFGGGTDYPAYYLQHGGATLATTIDKYVYVTVQRRMSSFNNGIQVHYSQVESVNKLDQLKIPNVREALRFLNINTNIEIHLMSDLPARTGLGTSSATTVGALKALYGHQGKIISNEDIAKQTVFLEQEMIKERVGSQDQYICALGGFQYLRFMRDGSVIHEPVTLSRDRLDELASHLMMMFTGLQRSAHDVLEEQVRLTNECQLDDHLAVMRGQVETAIQILAGPYSICQFGELLHEAWKLKRKLSSKVSNQVVDDIYTKAREAGASGGKLLGAGSGGYMLLYVEPECQQAVSEALPELHQVPINFEPEGAQVIYYSPEKASGNSCESLADRKCVLTKKGSGEILGII